MEIGILSDLQTAPATGRLRDAGGRTREIVSYAVAADQAGWTSSPSASTTDPTSTSPTPPSRSPPSPRPPRTSTSPAPSPSCPPSTRSASTRTSPPSTSSATAARSHHRPQRLPRSLHPLRYRPRQLRRCLRREARPAVGDPRQRARHLVRPPPPRPARPPRPSPPAAGQAAPVDRGRPHPRRRRARRPHRPTYGPGWLCSWETTALLRGFGRHRRSEQRRTRGVDRVCLIARSMGSWG